MSLRRTACLLSLSDDTLILILRYLWGTKNCIYWRGVCVHFRHLFDQYGGWLPSLLDKCDYISRPENCPIRRQVTIYDPILDFYELLSFKPAHRQYRFHSTFDIRPIPTLVKRWFLETVIYETYVKIPPLLTKEASMELLRLEVEPPPPVEEPYETMATLSLRYRWDADDSPISIEIVSWTIWSSTIIPNWVEETVLLKYYQEWFFSVPDWSGTKIDVRNRTPRKFGLRTLQWIDASISEEGEVEFTLMTDTHNRPVISPRAVIWNPTVWTKSAMEGWLDPTKVEEVEVVHSMAKLLLDVNWFRPSILRVLDAPGAQLVHSLELKELEFQRWSFFGAAETYRIERGKMSKKDHMLGDPHPSASIHFTILDLWEAEVLGHPLPPNVHIENLWVLEIVFKNETPPSWIHRSWHRVIIN